MTRLPDHVSHPTDRSMRRNRLPDCGPTISGNQRAKDSPRRAACRTNRRGITRRDLLVVVIVLLLGLLLLFPFLLNRQTEDRRLQCQQRQMRVAQAALVYEGIQGKFPGFSNLQAVDAEGEAVPTGWAFAVLPYVDFDVDKQTGPKLHALDRYGESGPDDTRGKTPHENFSVLVCPEDLPPDGKPTPGWSSFVVNSGLPDASSSGQFPPDWPANGLFLDRFHQRQHDQYPYVTSLGYLNAHDGAEFTLLLSENVDSGKWTDWQEPLVAFVWVAEVAGGRATRGDKLLGINQQRGQGDGSIRFARPASYHPGGVNVTYARVEFLNEETDYAVFVRTMTADDAGLTEPGRDQPIGPPYQRVSEPSAEDG
jgi:hypothetical protein